MKGRATRAWTPDEIEMLILAADAMNPEGASIPGDPEVTARLRAVIYKAKAHAAAARAAK